MNAIKCIALAAVACAGMAACTAPSLKGQWGNEDYGMAFEFTTDDSVVVCLFGNDFPSTYRVVGDSLFVTVLNEEAAFQYELKGDTLFLTDNGETVPFLKDHKVEVELGFGPLDNLGLDDEEEEAEEE